MTCYCNSCNGFSRSHSHSHSQLSLSSLHLNSCHISACDGVWDVMSDHEAIMLLIDKYETEGPFENAANLLVQTAIQRGSADNVTVVVIFL